MKVLCVIDSLGSGGAQRQLVNLAIGFKEKGHEVSFLVYHNINFFQGQLDEAQIQIHYVIEANYLKRLLKIRKFLRDGNQDAVLSFLEASNFMCEIASLPYRKWKLIVGERNSNPNILKSFKLRAYRWFHLFTDYIVANSQENINIVSKINPILSKKKLRVIYNKVDVNLFSPVLNFKNENKLLNVIVLAGYRKQKNIEGLINGVNHLNDYYKNQLKIHWYGSAKNEYPEGETLKNAQNMLKMYNLEEIIFLHEEVKNIAEKIKQYDVVGLFSFYEGFPNTICEGMASGKPIIASAVSDVPVFIEEDINGFLCDPNDTQSIANALIRAIETPKEQLYEMGLRNRAKAEIMFSVEKTVDMYLEIFND
ncbi:MAG: glycosyltransferase [Flavobacteriaceae bacterium]|nr:glycosyltransferase [Flavobacteriaceae bacterium]